MNMESITGYTVIEAESLDAAEKLAKESVHSEYSNLRSDVEVDPFVSQGMQ